MKDFIAYCGLYCKNCKKFNVKCKGCKVKRPSWCKILKCCEKNKFRSCADCSVDVRKCKKFSNLFSKLIEIWYWSDRSKCIRYIKKFGYKKFEKKMKKLGRECLRK